MFEAKKKQKFTMIEIIVVLVIMGIMMAIGAAGIGGLGRGRKVAAAARQIGGKLNMARAYAVTKRKYVAVLLPDNNLAGGTSNNDLKDLYAGKSKSRACVVSYDGANWDFEQWIDGNIWQNVPAGVFCEITTPATATTVTSLPNDLDSGSTSTNPVTCPAVIFKPSGAANSTAVVSSFEGVYNKDTHTVVRSTAKDTSNMRGWLVNINEFTGRVSYEKE